MIHTGDTVMEARRSIADGATIIIARGLQASIIKQYTDTPVVEIVLTAQEMALLIMRAKQIAGKGKAGGCSGWFPQYVLRYVLFRRAL